MIITEGKFIKNISAVLIVDVFTKALAFLILPFYLNIMPKSEFGEFGFILTTSITCSTLLSLSLYVIIIKDIAKESNYEIQKNYFSTLIIFTIIFNLFVFISLFIAEYHFSILSNFFDIQIYHIEKIFCILLIIFLNVISLFQYSLLLAKKKSRDICFYIFLKFLFSNMIAIIFLLNFKTYFDTVLLRLLGLLCGEILLCVSILIIMKKNYISFNIDYEYLRSKFSVTTPLIFASIFSLAMVSVDRKLLQNYYGNDYLAEFNLAYLLLLPISMIVASIQSIWSPRLFTLKNFEIALIETKKAILLVFISLIIVVIFIFFTLYFLFYYNLLNDEYYNVLPLIVALSIGIILGSLINFIDGMNLYVNKTYYKLIVTIVIVTFYILLNILLIPSFSYYGIAISLFISNLIGLIIGYLLILRYKKKYAP